MDLNRSASPSSEPASSPLPASAGHALQAWVATQHAVLEESWVGVAHGCVEAVHRARVAVRRLRVVFASFGTLIDHDAGLERDLRTLGRRLGDVRDADVWCAHLEDARGSGAAPGVTSILLADAHDRRGEAAAALAPFWNGAWADELRVRLANWVQSAPWTPQAALPAALGLAAPVAQTVERTRQAWRRAQRRAADPSGWHEVRKAAKAVRYGYELAQDAGAFTGRAAVWERVTEAFGGLQDATMAQAILAATADGRADDWACLVEAEADRAAAALRAGQEALVLALAQEGRGAGTK